MRAKVVAIANRKGGVGKTTLALSLAEGLAALKKKRILVIDLDAQVNMSMLMCGGVAPEQMPWKVGKSVVDLINQRTLNGEGTTSFFICRDILDHAPGKTVSLLAGDPRLMSLERKLLARPGSSVEGVLKLMRDVVDSVLKEQGELYDVIMFDCPPGFSLITEAALSRADLVVLPTSPTMLASQGVRAYVDYLEDDVNIADTASKTYVFLTMTGRTNTSAAFEQLIREEVKKADPKYRLFETHYAYCDGFQKATDRREQNIRKVKAIWRRLDQMRGRALFHRLYRDVWPTVAKAVGELSKTLELEGAIYEGNATRPNSSGALQPEARV